jgi:hypothetical protein
LPLYTIIEKIMEELTMTRKYREMILDAAETVLGYFGFDRTLYGDKKKYQNANGGGWKN